MKNVEAGKEVALNRVSIIYRSRLWGICFIVKGRTFSTPDRPKKTEAKLGSEMLNPGAYLSRCRVSSLLSVFGQSNVYPLLNLMVPS